MLSIIKFDLLFRATVEHTPSEYFNHLDGTMNVAQNALLKYKKLTRSDGKKSELKNTPHLNHKDTPFS